MKIFSPFISNDYLSVLPRNAADAISVISSVNNRELLPNWNIVEFEFKAFNKGGRKTPDITCIGGGIAFRSELKDLIFPGAREKLEFLPITVSDEKWLIVSCLKSTKCYDSKRSLLFRRGGGQIFMINHIVVKDATLVKGEIFVIDDSNRATLLVVPEFVERVSKLGIKGINFKEIGILE